MPRDVGKSQRIVSNCPGNIQDLGTQIKYLDISKGVVEVVVGGFDECGGSRMVLLFFSTKKCYFGLCYSAVALASSVCVWRNSGLP